VLQKYNMEELKRNSRRKREKRRREDLVSPEF
jgi:hypothetical protein